MKIPGSKINSAGWTFDKTVPLQKEFGGLHSLLHTFTAGCKILSLLRIRSVTSLNVKFCTTVGLQLLPHKILVIIFIFFSTGDHQCVIMPANHDGQISSEKKISFRLLLQYLQSSSVSLTIAPSFTRRLYYNLPAAYCADST